MSKDLKKLEALLFMTSGPISKKKIMTFLNCDSESVEKYIQELSELRAESGVTIIDSGLHIELATHSDALDVVEKIEKENTTGPLSKSAQETLSIISYAGPITKTDIDFLRGVNTQYAVRRLAMRGLIFEKKEGRSKFLVCSPEFLMHLGITKLEELPEYYEVRKTIMDGIASAKKRMEEHNV